MPASSCQLSSVRRALSPGRWRLGSSTSAGGGGGGGGGGGVGRQATDSPAVREAAHELSDFTAASVGVRECAGSCIELIASCVVKRVKESVSGEQLSLSQPTVYTLPVTDSWQSRCSGMFSF